MKTKIKSSLLEPSWFEKAIFDTLDLYEKGKDLRDCPLAEFYRNYKTWGGRHMSITTENFEESLKKRMESFIKLYKDIKINGYKDIAPFFVWFDNDGFIHTYDGHHRLSIIRYLGIDPEVEIMTDWTSKGIDPSGIEGTDYPLVEIATSIWGYKRLYHFVNDPLGRLKDFTTQRPDTEERRNYILNNLVNHQKGFSGSTPSAKVLDIGCSEGYLCHEIAKTGYDVTGIEKGYIPNEEGRGRKLIATARYLATLQSIKADFILSDWKDILRKNVFYDNILYLSVLHNEINALGYDAAMNNLQIFRGKCKRLFIEIPDINIQKDWEYAFKVDEFIPKAERLTGMAVKEVWNGYRPIILLENKLYEN
jgi:SAM-dependent methyltransferase